MPKAKTKRSLKKRVKITGTGKILRRGAYMRHLTAKKSSKRKRALGKNLVVHDTNAAQMKRQLPYG